MKSQDRFNLVSNTEDQCAIEEQWFMEAKRRLDELHSGEVDGIAADEVFSMARENLALK